LEKVRSRKLTEKYLEYGDCVGRSLDASLFNMVEFEEVFYLTAQYSGTISFMGV
jgi:hypothetical protein